MTENTQLQKLFFNQIPVETLLHIKNMEEPYASKIREKTKTTNAHTIRIIQRMEKLELVEKEELGRKNILKLTAEGEALAEKLEEVY